MKKVFFVLCILISITLLANDHGWVSNSTVTVTHAKINEYNTERDPLDYIPNNSGGNHYYEEIRDIDNSNSPSRYAPCWADDLLVSSQWNLASRSKIAIDYDIDGNIYVGGLSANTQNDTLKFFKSTDNGYTWNQIWFLTNSAPLEFIDFDMRVGHAGSDPNIYFAFTDSHFVANERQMWFCIYDQVNTSFNMIYFDPDTSTFFVSPTNIAMDLTDAVTPSIWVTYNRITTTTGWSSVSSTDGGTTWETQAHSTTNGGGGCDVCVGPDDYVYIVNIYTESNNRVRMNIRQFSAYGDYLNVSPTASEDRAFPCVASEISETYGSNVVHVLYQTGSGGSRRIKNSFSNDGGVNWTIDDFWSPIGDIWAVRPNVRCGWNCDHFISIATRIAGFDSLATAFTTTTAWGTVAYVSDHLPTGEITPDGFVRQTTGRQLIYREWGSDNLWYDRYNYTTGVEEINMGTPAVMSISNNGHQMDIMFTLDKDQFVKINIFDVSGRNVLNVCNQMFSAGEHSLNFDLSDLNGSYIVNFESETNRSSEKFFLF